jgi:integrase
MGVVYRQQGRTTWMLKYYRDGRAMYESAGTTVKDEATALLKKHEGATANGATVSKEKLRFENAAANLVNDYKINHRRSLDERAQFETVRSHLPDALQPVVTAAFVTGWRIASEILPLQRRHVNLDVGELRLDPGTTKNREGRVFTMTRELRVLFEAQKAERDLVAQACGEICPWVFFRMVATGRGGQKRPRRIVSLTKAWAVACRAAGCPGRIPHDLRRSAARNVGPTPPFCLVFGRYCSQVVPNFGCKSFVRLLGRSG